MAFLHQHSRFSESRHQIKTAGILTTLLANFLNVKKTKTMAKLGNVNTFQVHIFFTFTPNNTDISIQSIALVKAK